MESNRYDFHDVKFSENLTHRLNAVLKTYEELAGSDPNKLRSMIPAEEVWRFFVEASVQENGRGLKDSEFFKASQSNKVFSFSPLSLTVKEYIEVVEKVSMAERNAKSKFTKFLKSRQWVLSDEECSHFTLNDLLALDKAWLPFEQNEPNYFRALYIAFPEIFNSQKFDLNFIKELQKLSVHLVRGTNYEDNTENAGEFRKNSESSFLILPAFATKRGFVEFLERADTNLSFELEISENGWMVGWIRINRDSLPLIKQYAQQIADRAAGKIFFEGRFLLHPLLTTPDIKEFIDKIKSDKAIEKILLELGLTKTLDEAAIYLHGLLLSSSPDVRLHLCSFQESLDENIILEQLNNKMQSYLDEFEKVNQVLAPRSIEKLYVIVSWVLDSELLHPFYDAHGRTICMLALMYLCNQAGFPIPLLEDSNRFNLYDKETLVLELIKGMENTLKLAAQPANEKCLFNVKTTDILQFLQSKPYLQEKAKYFLEMVAIEEKNRSVVKPLLNM